MKNLLFFFLFIACPAFAQDVKLAKNGLPLNSKVIVVESDMEQKQLFEAVASVLFDEGYQIKNSDKDTGIIQTDNKNVKGGWYVRLSLSVSSGKVRIRGSLFVPGAVNDEIENYGMRGSLNLLAFLEMDRVAKLIPHASISYL